MPALVGRIRARPEQGRIVEASRLVVPSDADARPHALDRPEDRGGERRRLRRGGIRAQEAAAHAQVEDERSFEIALDDLRGLPSRRADPVRPAGPAGNGLEAAREPQRVVRESRRDAVEPPESLPGRSLADRYVGIVGLVLATIVSPIAATTAATGRSPAWSTAQPLTR